MTQQPDIQSISITDILEKLRYQAQSLPPSPTSSRYLRALASLTAATHTASSARRYCVASGQRSDAASASSAPFARAAADGFSSSVESSSDTLSESSAPLREISSDNADNFEDSLRALLSDWLVSQWLCGQPFSTVSLYLDIISSLYGSAVKAGQLPKTNLFSWLKASLKALGPQGWKSGIDHEIFTRALRLTKNAARLIADDSIAADIVLWSLTHCLQPLTEIALLKRQAALSSSRICENAENVENTENSSTSGQRSDAASAPSAPSAKEAAVGPSPAVEISSNTLSEPSAPLREIPPSALRTAAPPREIIELRQTIVARHAADARRKYLFPLRQSERTPKQLSKTVARIVNALFKRARLPQATDPWQTVEALWAYAALSAGIPASRLVSYLGHAPLGLPVLKLSAISNQQSESAAGLSSLDSSPLTLDSSDSVAALDSSLLTLDSYKEDFAQVGEIFLENPPRWYAMSLRPGVRFTQVCRRIQLISSSNVQRPTSNASLELFYPCEEIARAIGKKIVVKERPFIHSVVFFRARITDIGPLFARIGDLAWCYRQSARPGAPYADISERQFQLFQQTIARFTPDYEVAPTGELELRKNDRVQILGGLFAGQEATFDSVGKAEEGVVYRLNIVGENGFDWRIKVDKRLAAPASRN